MQDHYTRTKKIHFGALAAAIFLLIQPVANAQSDTQILELVRSCQSVVGQSSRLSCYDRILPPAVAAEENVDSPVAREERITLFSKPQQSIENTAEIIEVKSPNIRTFTLVAADGRVFSQSNSASKMLWPQIPFKVGIEQGFLGTIYLRIPGNAERIRVKLED